MGLREEMSEIYSDNALIKHELDWDAKFSLEDCLKHSGIEKESIKFKYKSEKNKTKSQRKSQGYACNCLAYSVPLSIA